MRDPTREEIIAQIMRLSRDVKDIWNEIDDIKSGMDAIWKAVNRTQVVKQPRRKSKRSR
jgi:hypothetical protein